VSASLALGAVAALVLGSVFLLPGGREPPRWALWARMALVAIFLALFVVDARGGHEMQETIAYRAILLAAFVAALLLMLRSAIRNWNDEDALDEEFGPNDGYIVRPRRLSPRARAVASLVFLFAILALFAVLVFLNTSLPE
jgi:hypothetical protein